MKQLEGPVATQHSGRVSDALAAVRVQLPLLITALLTLVVTVFCIAAFREMRAAAIERTRDDVWRAARQIAAISASGTRRQAEALRATAHDTAVVQALLLQAGAPRPAAFLQPLTAGADSVVESRELWTPGGQRRVMAGTPSTASDSLALHDALRDAQHPRPVADSAVRSPLYSSGGRVRTWLVVPVQSGGRTIGYLAERRRLANSPQVETRVRQLMGHDVGVYITNTRHDLWTDVRGSPVPAPVDTGDTRIAFEAPSKGGLLFGARAAVASTPWEIVLTLPESQVVARPRQFLRRMLIVGLALLLLGLVGAWLLSRRVTEPLGALARAEESAALARELALQNRELEHAWEQALRAVHHIERLQAATAALAGALDRQTVINVFAREALALSGATAGAAYRLSEDGHSLELARSSAAWGSADASTRIELGHVSLIASAVKDGSATYFQLPHVHDEDGNGSHDGSALLPLQGRAFVVLPLTAHERVSGVLILGFAEARDFSTGLRASLEALAAQCGQAMERILAYEDAVNARLAAEAASRTKSQFLAMMSHELRTPLNAIGGYAELMEMGLHGGVTEQQRTDLARIQRSKHHLLSIINDLLDHASLEAGRLMLQLAPVPVHEVLVETEALMAPQVAAKGLHLDTTQCATDAIVCADRDKLRRVMINLLANALRFTNTGGTIRIACETAPDRVQVRVSDTGIGIPRELRERIFEPFTQVDDGLTRRAGGTGLGLSISRQLAEAMGGTLTVESIVGKGSSFVLSLPALAAANSGSAG